MRRAGSRYDLVVLGGGTAGIVASTYAAALGARVALVEAELPGGDCLWTGCVPSKALIAAAATAHVMRTPGSLGIAPAQPQVDFVRVMEHVHRAIARAGRPDTPEALARRGVEVVAGRGRFTGPGRLEAGGRELRYRAAIVATGTTPAPSRPGQLTTDTVWDLRELPRTLLVIGGGPSGVELAQAFGRLGSEVTLSERAERLLPGLEPEAGALLGEVLSEEGVQVRLGDRASAEAPAAGEVLSVTGRRPASEELGLETVGVQTDAAGWLRADARLRTTGDRIWAAGDVLGGPQSTHAAGHQGAVAALNALLRARRSFDAVSAPRVVFSDPEIAAVGLTESEARSRVGRAEVLRHDYAESDRAITEERARGFAKLVCDRRGRLLGATVVAPHAAESAALLGSLVKRRASAAELSQVVFPYPTYAEGAARAAESWWARRRLTPRTRRLMRPVLAALRVADRPRG